MTAKKTQGSRTDPPLQVDSLYGQAAQTIHNYASVYIGCPPPEQHYQLAQRQADFKKLTGIWCPVEAQADLQILQSKFGSPLSVWWAWRLTYIEWDEAQSRLCDAVSWQHVVLVIGLAAGLGHGAFYLVPVAQANVLTVYWVGFFSYLVIKEIVLLIALELMVLQPWKVARMIRRTCGTMKI